MGWSTTNINNMSRLRTAKEDKISTEEILNNSKNKPRGYPILGHPLVGCSSIIELLFFKLKLKNHKP